jgi:hypothetical protein
VFEVKWDGFRAIVSTEGEPLRSRRGWNMADVVPELSALPIAATLDGELVAFGEDGQPDFPLLCERMLMRRPRIAFDIHGVHRRRSMTAKPCLRPCARTTSRESLRNGATVSTGPRGMLGSRRRIATTGAGRWSTRARSTGPRVRQFV